ncbi:6,7-dimethyl-8-ribityllumazine synthase [Halosquirtibacter laminarini]|uniref:6,7-dimethyl-8-ribityllumazine synthase n=1 Tax=Halosquirtibacter laminarini TaxID=3374600 RepID=A0AC61NN96_9BACT|nr:6,7-dimethyl-8-ribityllumazine synthase [Prolixibacteraceae bacterium]
MATKNLSEYNFDAVPSAQGMKIGLVVAEWNYHITGSMAQGAKDTLMKHGVSEEDIIIKHVPGTFELPLGGQWMAEYTDVDAIIHIGCVIQGQTRHFDYVCDGVTKGTTDLNLKYNKPFIFCVLTDNEEQQSIDRSGGKLGNKGDEAAVAAIKMVDLKKQF